MNGQLPTWPSVAQMPAEIAHWFRYLCNRFGKSAESPANALHAAMMERHRQSVDPFTGIRYDAMPF